MRKRFRITVLWLAAAFVLAGSAFSFAKVGDNHGAEVSAQHRHATPTATPSVNPGDDKNENESEPADNESNDHPLNHGFYVSAAAHCKDVTGFTAPADCDSNGKAHGQYVSSVAKSDLGKGNKDHHGSDSGEGS